MRRTRWATSGTCIALLLWGAPAIAREAETAQARRGNGDRAFLEQASQIVVDEVESLERRVRAFSDFAAEPPVRPGSLDVNAVLQERVAFLRTAHPEVVYSIRLADGAPRACADEDLIRGILTNLLENAAEACGSGGRILAATAAVEFAGKGYSVMEMDGGFAAWKAHDLEIESDVSSSHGAWKPHIKVAA